MRCVRRSIFGLVLTGILAMGLSLEKLSGELAELEEKSASLTARWHAEKDKLGSEQKLKEQLDAARNELTQVQRRGEYQRAGELAYGVIPGLERRLAET